MNPEEYEILKKKLHDYEQSINKNKLKTHICVSCKTTIVEPLFTEVLSHKNTHNQETMSYSSGGVGVIHFGYGSSYDMSTYYVALCDDCVENLISQGLLHEK